VQDSTSTFHDEIPAAPRTQVQPALPIEPAALSAVRAGNGRAGRSPAFFVFVFVVMFAAGGAAAWHWPDVESRFAQTCKDVGDWRNTVTKSLTHPTPLMDNSPYMTIDDRTYPFRTFSDEDMHSLQFDPIDVMGDQSLIEDAAHE